jgi:hypothetical protein
MATIVLIHGIAQEQYSADLLESQWVPALAGGVRTAGFPDIADRLRTRAGADGIDTRMAFYGHLFLRPGMQGAGDDSLTPAQEALAEQLSLEWLQRAQARATDEKQRQVAAIELAQLRPDPARQAQGLRSMVRGFYNSLARLRWFARLGNAIVQRFVVKALSQVTCYLSNDAARAEIQQIVLNLIGADTRIIVAHSLGSIVAYEVAHRLNHPLPLLVTLGSPLGVNTIVLPELRPLASFPQQVRRWVNVADRDDLVAAEPNLTDLFGASLPRDAIFEGSYTVDNGAQPHDAQFYLGKAHIGRPIGQVLSAH